MARIAVGTWMVRYPLGGNLSWSIQWLVGFQRLGHDVFLLEKSGYANSCFDPARGVMSDDCSYGISTVNELLSRFGLQDRWCFVDAAGHYHGLTRARVRGILSSLDLLVDLGSHGAWNEEVPPTALTLVVDGEPGFRQMKMSQASAAGAANPEYDFYYSNGANIGTERTTAPTAGKHWRPIYNPVVTDLFAVQPSQPHAAFTTVMNWQAHDPLVYDGKIFGQKDIEFAKFLDLPRRARPALEVAIAGRYPRKQLEEWGWRVRTAHDVTSSFDAYQRYISESLGEFSVCKNVFVATKTGWFSDRSAAYLASGRPVVLQDTGFGTHLPCGRGLFAVSTVDEAADAIEQIRRDYALHSAAARDIAEQHLESSKVLGRLVRDIGL